MVYDVVLSIIIFEMSQIVHGDSFNNALNEVTLNQYRYFERSTKILVSSLL